MKKVFSKLFILVALIFVFSSEVVMAADLNSMVSKIFNWVQTALTTIETLIIVAVGIYFLKNLLNDRKKFLFNV